MDSAADEGKLDSIFSKIGELSQVQRYLIYFGTIVVLLGCFIWLSYLPKNGKIVELEDQLEKVEQELKVVTIKAAKLPRLQKEIKAAEVEFRIVKETLPEKKDIPSLLTSISQAGRAADLEFRLFEPKKEKKRDFYAEIPVGLQISGSYHNLAVFFDSISRLSRIVNIKNLKLKKGKDKLSINCQAVTYRFLESKEAKK
ncbi:MAG: type 4a pilus biogenesis protein PilO [Desulfobacterales bacterium]|jgi:type IV pilus assembly protein PilO|nr:type 4a pilus biogenesis protein PilO [Desulfobacteraceae bacterium]MBT4365712.1 type 4a pilus biogenesis protein PilO [Desulfobacteraceae bacterium]MBT7086775.1 type 4a pilus biogenesis protein PilO [Desulfobacterales bacterium]MBT7696092.1 type 4a pilus biogenesis protein PilO [Desulfobacterales bacterium]